MNLLSIAFTAIYVFSFREATKRAAAWGAFQFPAKNRKLMLKKFVCSSVLILWLLPLLFYWLSLKVISQPTINAKDPLSLIVDIAFWKIPPVALLGFFPRTAKNLWNLVAQYKVAKGTAAGQPGEGWINRNVDLSSDLPYLSYSWELVVLLGISQAVVLIYLLRSQQVSFEVSREELTHLFAMVYVSELIVLHHRAKSLRYFYPELNPKHLIAGRTIPSVIVSVLFPIIFGIACSPWVLWLQRETNDCCFWVGFELSLLGLGFPIYCNNFLLREAKKRKWATPEVASDEFGGPAWYWILGLVSIAAFVLVTWPKWELYKSYSTEILKWAPNLR